MRFSSWLRLFRIYGTLIRYVVNPTVLKGQKGLYWLGKINIFKSGLYKTHNRGDLLCLTMESLGPVFVKFGQLISIREDLFPQDVIKSLSKLQDNVKPFDAQVAVSMIEKAIDQSIDSAFISFDQKPLASASIAQVHAAILHHGESVVVKVLRPNIRSIIKRDVQLLYKAASLINFSWEQAYRLRLKELVSEFEATILDELDLMREAANAQQLRRNFENNDKLMVPKIYWSLTRSTVMVQERVNGVSIADLSMLRAKQVNMKVLAENGVEIFFTQVFRDSFFHADMHPGNLFVDISDPNQPKYVGVDFGIMGSLSPSDQRYLAENLLAFFKRDYRRVAILHIESGWVSPDTRVDHFEGAIRAVCEPIFEKPLQEISFGRILLRLFQVVERFDMYVQPQLMLLQKTLFNIEALGRSIYPDLDLWSTAQPFLERFVREQNGLPALAKTMWQDFPQTAEQLIKMPDLMYRFLHHAKVVSTNNDVPAPLIKKTRGSFMWVASGLLLLGLPWIVSHVHYSSWHMLSWMSGLVMLGLGVWIRSKKTD